MQGLGYFYFSLPSFRSFLFFAIFTLSGMTDAEFNPVSRLWGHLQFLWCIRLDWPV